MIKFFSSKKIQYFYLLFFVCSTTALYGQKNLPKESTQSKLDSLDNYHFIENKGQWPNEVLYLAKLNGLNAWITREGMLHEFFKKETVITKNDGVLDKFEVKKHHISGHRVAYKFIGNNVNVKTEGLNKKVSYYNYFIGNDPSKHATNVGLYKEIIIKDLYHGIDMRYYFDKGFLRYDYILKPEADPSQIQFRIEGSEKTFINKKGDLVFNTSLGEISNSDLYCYHQQDKEEVMVSFDKKGENWSFALGTYNTCQTLIIDPLIYSTYIGGSSDDSASSIDVDELGNAYISGLTNSTDYITSLGAFNVEYNDHGDIFMTKLNPNGSQIIYSTYIGGKGGDHSTSIKVDNVGNAYITGYTTSTSADFPTTNGSFQTTRNGSNDSFVVKLNTTGSSLIYSTFIGGDNSDNAESLVVDLSGNVYVAGYTHSTDFPSTPGAYQSIFDDYWDVFIVKLNPDGSNLVYATHFGHGICSSIDIDNIGNAYITGYTYSPNFPISVGAYQSINEGITDVFVTKLNNTGTNLIYSTYLGGSGIDEANSLVIDKDGNAYVTGKTLSNNFDISNNAFQSSNKGGFGDIFVSKLNNTGTGLVYSTYIGGNGQDLGSSIAVDGSNNAYITGYTSSSDFDITPDASQTINDGNLDAFFTKINNIGTGLIYSTYLGGSGNDQGRSIALDYDCSIYIGGSTVSTDFDITTEALKKTNANGSDIFVTKMRLPSPDLENLGSSTLCVGGTTNFLPSSGGFWTSSNPAVATIDNLGLVTAIGPGKVRFTFSDNRTICPVVSVTNEIIVINCPNPDFNVTKVNVSVSGDVSTNDNISTGTIYGPVYFLQSKPIGSVEALIVNANGTYLFTANTVGVYKYTVPLCDPNSISACPTSDLWITVVDNYQPEKKPIANVDLATTKTNINVTLNTLQNDRCVVVAGCLLEPSSVKIITHPKYGAANVNTSSGNITYDPNPTFLGLDTLVYEICVTGESTNCATAKQIISVLATDAVNTTTASDDFAITQEGKMVSGDLKANDLDAEGDLQTIAAKTETIAGKGTLTLASDGTYTYTPDIGFTGPVEFTYTTCDNNVVSDCAKATLHILVVPDLIVQLRVYLEGSLINNGNQQADGRPLMRDQLRAPILYIPLSDPYRYNGLASSVAPNFSYPISLADKFPHVGPGGRSEFREILDPTTVLSVSDQDAVVDWVFIQLRRKTDTVTVATRSGLLQRDGDVIDVNGISGLRFSNVAMDDYFVAVKHRSHLGAMTLLPQNPTALTTLVNFTSPTLPLFEYQGFKDLAMNSKIKSGYRALWAGDFDSSGKIKYESPFGDLNNLYFEVINFPGNLNNISNFNSANGYLSSDYDMNGKSKFDNPNDDKNYLFFQVVGYLLNLKRLVNYSDFNQQIPNK